MSGGYDPVAGWLAAARYAWPEVDVPEDAFRRAIDERVVDDVLASQLHLSDLYLALGCTLGLPAALRAFEAEHVARVGAWLLRSEQDRAVIDEVRQRVRTRVLVGHDGAPPRIADYSARGPLGAWVRVVALREHATLKRDGRSEAELDADGLDSLTRSGELTPELLALKARYRALLSDAFRQALLALPPRARTLLRLCYVEDMPMEAIGTVYGVNKSTISRWLAVARADVLEGARAHVRAELHAPPAEVESLLGLVRSELELSLQGLLAP